MSDKLGYKSVADLRDNYPDFFCQKVRPYIGDALRYLRSTERLHCNPDATFASLSESSRDAGQRGPL